LIGDYEFALVRLLSSGIPDPDFGTGGKVITDFDGLDDRGRGVVVLPGGKIVVAGFATLDGPASAHFALARYQSGGAPDTNFGTSGKALINFGSPAGGGV